MTLLDALEELAATRARLHGLQRRRIAATVDNRAPTAYAWLAAGKPLRAVEGLRDLDHALSLARQWASRSGAPWPPQGVKIYSRVGVDGYPVACEYISIGGRTKPAERRHPMSNVTYTTIGSVRGSCGHNHRTLATAQACADRDNRAVKRGNGASSYSDRSVCHSDGSRLSMDEMEALQDLLERW